MRQKVAPAIGANLCAALTLSRVLPMERLHFKRSGMSEASKAPQSFQEIILRLQAYWAAQGCAVLQPYDMEVGAGTFHPATTLRSLGS